MVIKNSTKTTWLFHQNQHEFQDRQGLGTDNSNWNNKSIISMEHKNSLKESRKRHSRPFKHAMASISFKGCNKPPLHINNITIIQQQYKYRGNKCLSRFIVLHNVDVSDLAFKSPSASNCNLSWINSPTWRHCPGWFLCEWMKQSCNIQIWF